MSALVFLDTETTGLSLDDDIWEIAAIRREEDGRETELHLFVEHDPMKCRSLPDSFKADHEQRFPSRCSGRVSTPKHAIFELADLCGDDKPHLVGAVPNFDAERLRLMAQREWPNWPRHEFWHYHLIDVENLAVGYLAGHAFPGDTDESGKSIVDPPWDSNALSAAVGVDPERFPRHTAMGDVRWAMAIYDAVVNGRES